MVSPSPVPRATDTAEIGRTSVRLSRLGLGGVALSGAPPATDPQRPTPEDEGVALIRRSLALGLTYLDLGEKDLAAPIFQQAFIWGVGPRVEESGATLIQGYPYAAPGEDLKVK